MHMQIGPAVLPAHRSSSGWSAPASSTASSSSCSPARSSSRRHEPCSADVPFPAWQPHPDVWLLVGAVRGRVRDRDHAARTAPRARGHAGRHAVPDRVVLGGAARAVGRVRLADPRPRRALPLLGAHGAAHHVLDHRRAAAADRHADVARALAAVAAVAAPDGAVHVARFIPATIIFNLVVIVTHTPVVVNASLRHTARCTSSSTR